MIKKISVYALILTAVFFCFSYPKVKKGGAMDLKMTSPAFVEGGMIPAKYTCAGENISPALEWSNVPVNVKSFALICDDPDAPAGTWVHWVIYNIPASVQKLEAGVPDERELTNGAKQGMNSSRHIGYDGPCPPGGTHRYYFKLYALDALLGLDAGVTKEMLLKEMEKHIAAKGQLMGKYSR